MGILGADASKKLASIQYLQIEPPAQSGLQAKMLTSFKRYVHSGHNKQRKKLKYTTVLGEKSAFSTEVRLAHGRRVFDYIRDTVPNETERKEYYKKKFRFPHGFWAGFFKKELSSPLTKQRYMMYKRHFMFFLERKRAGAVGGGAGPDCDTMESMV